MLKSRIKQRAAAGASALSRLGQIEASVVALNNDDLLDLADIFKDRPSTPLTQIAALEMRRRGISLEQP